MIHILTFLSPRRSEEFPDRIEETWVKKCFALNLDNSQVCAQGVPPGETPKTPAEPGAATALRKSKRKRETENEDESASD